MVNHGLGLVWVLSKELDYDNHLKTINQLLYKNSFHRYLYKSIIGKYD